MEISGKAKGLPENAYRKLAAGEEYVPVVPAGQIVPELTRYSLVWGLFYAVLFSAAAAYLGLKIGQVFEAAIPIAILAVGMSVAAKRKDALQQNVIIQSIGAASGVIVAGAIFTIPGLYILGLDKQAGFFRVFMASFLGGVLGILFLIPFRKYFVKDQHGEFPFPEATATTEVLVAGEAGGDQAKTLLGAAIVGGAYDFLVSSLELWREVFSTTVFKWGQKLAGSMHLDFRINIGAAVMGLGYIVGLRYAAIICAGSFLSWWVLVPAFCHIGGDLTTVLGSSATKIIKEMTPNEVFTNYVRHVGIGGIAMAGLIGIFKSRKIIWGAFQLAAKELRGGAVGHGAGGDVRTQRDLPMKWIAILTILGLVAVFLFFWLGVVGNLGWAVAGLLIVTIVSFLFTTVAARAIAIVGTNPVSGMTLMTLIISSVILVNIGLKGDQGIVAALLIGGVVCTALSVAGGFITDLKIGYWLGTTPAVQERWKFLGVLFSAASVGAVILLLNKTYGFGAEKGGLEAPQASAMAAVLKPLMTGAPAPWLLYLAGVMMAIVLEMVGVPPLAFALGMYLPLHLNTPILAGGIVAHIVSTRSKREEVNNARREKGTLIASGFIAGGAIMGVVAALVLFFGRMIVGSEEWTVNKALGLEAWTPSPGSAVLSVVMFVALCVYTVRAALGAKKECRRGRRRRGAIPSLDATPRPAAGASSRQRSSATAAARISSAPKISSRRPARRERVRPRRIAVSVISAAVIPIRTAGASRRAPTMPMPTPTASASRLVATERPIRDQPRVGSKPSPESAVAAPAEPPPAGAPRRNASQSIFSPTSARMAAPSHRPAPSTRASRPRPRSQPHRGIRNWKRPKWNDSRNTWRGPAQRVPTESPTAKASQPSPTARASMETMPASRMGASIARRRDARQRRSWGCPAREPLEIPGRCGNLAAPAAIRSGRRMEAACASARSRRSSWSWAWRRRRRSPRARAAAEVAARRRPWPRGHSTT